MPREPADQGRYFMTAGPDLHCYQDITREEYVNLCKALGKALDKEDPTAGHKFIPESITEGGFFLKEYRGKKTDSYKTIRHFISKGGTRIEWPFLKGNEITSWVGDKTVVIPEEAVCHLNFKRRNAPPWTVDDIRAIVDVFNSFGLRAGTLDSKGKFKVWNVPKKKSYC